MNIIEKLLPINKYSRPGKERKGILGIEVHWVANPKTTAAFNRRWFEISERYGSTQYIIDLDGKIFQIIPDSEIAYSSGAKKYNSWVEEKLGTPPYMNTLSIECTHIDKAGKMTDETYNSLLDLCIYLCDKYKLDSRNLYLHYDITGKKCHKYFVDNPGEWEYFKESVEGGLK